MEHQQTVFCVIVTGINRQRLFVPLPRPFHVTTVIQTHGLNHRFPVLCGHGLRHIVGAPDEIAHEQAFGDIRQVHVAGELPVKTALRVRQRVHTIEYLLHVIGSQTVTGITAEEGQPVMLVRV